MAVNPTTGLSDTEMVPTMNLRWFSGILQQAWAPRYGGRIEWRDVPLVHTDGVKTCDGGQSNG